MEATVIGIEMWSRYEREPGGGSSSKARTLSVRAAVYAFTRPGSAMGGLRAFLICPARMRALSKRSLTV
jgi:hypothetical protein